MLFSTHWWRSYQTRSDVIRIVFSLLMSSSLGGLGRPLAMRRMMARTPWGRGLMPKVLRYFFFSFDKVPLVYHWICSSVILFYQIHYEVVFHGDPNPCTAVWYCMVRYDWPSLFWLNSLHLPFWGNPPPPTLAECNNGGWYHLSTCPLVHSGQVIPVNMEFLTV